MENPLNFSQNYPLSILIAENRQDARFSAHAALLELGYRPEIATTSQEMIKMTGTKSYDVVLMDVHLPEAEDILASRRNDASRGDGSGNRRPILIAMTMSGPADFREMWLEAGMDHSIAKPVDPEELTLQLMACSVLTGSRRIL